MDVLVDNGKVHILLAAPLNRKHGGVVVAVGQAKAHAAHAVGRVLHSRAFVALHLSHADSEHSTTSGIRALLRPAPMTTVSTPCAAAAAQTPVSVLRQLVQKVQLAPRRKPERVRRATVASTHSYMATVPQLEDRAEPMRAPNPGVR